MFLLREEAVTTNPSRNRLLLACFHPPCRPPTFKSSSSGDLRSVHSPLPRRTPVGSLFFAGFAADRRPPSNLRRARTPLRRLLFGVVSSAGSGLHPQPSNSPHPAVFLWVSAGRRPPEVVKQPLFFIPVSVSSSFILLSMHRTDRTLVPCCVSSLIDC